MSDPCAECFLRNRTRVPFEGPLDAAYGIVGEAPGATECRAKRPFHPDGPSGRLLSTLLRHVGIDRDVIRVGNAILCGPISDADRQNPAFKDVLARCAERREAEEDLGSVRTILAAGRMAADGLLGEQVVLGGRQPRRGALHRDAHGRAVFPTWHPAALLRSGGDNTKGGKKGGGGLSDAEVETLGFDIERSWQFANGAREEFKPELLTTLDPVIFTNWVRENVYASGVSRISLDTETDSVDPTKANLLLVGIAAETPKKDIRAVSFWWPNADSATKELLTHLLGREELQVAYQNCLTSDTRVLMADGSKRKLGSLVSSRSRELVWSLNEKTGQLEKKPIVGWIRKEVRPWRDWIRIRVRSKGSIRATKEHRILTARGWIEAGEVRVGDLVCTGKPALTQVQRAMIYGSLLGDMSIIRCSRSSKVSVSHSEAQEEYLLLKRDVLQGIGKRSVGIRRSIHFGGFSAKTGTKLVTAFTGVDGRLNVAADACLTKNKKKRLSDAWLNELTPAALAIWFCDDGCVPNVDRGRSISMSACVTAIGKQSASRLVAYLHRLGWNARTWVRKEDGQRYLTIASRKGYQSNARRKDYQSDPKMVDFWESIAPFVPVCMSHKLPVRFRHLASDLFWRGEIPETTKQWFDTVVEVGPLLRQKGVKGRYGGYTNTHGRKSGLAQYCLTVADNHNFLAEGLVVANCQYDLSVFERRVAPPRNKVFDTLLGMHAAFPEVKLDLGSIAHTFLVVPPWKFLFRQWERQHKRDVTERTPEWVLRNSQYNAMDSATTLAIVDPIVRECEKRKVLQIHDIDVRLALIARKMTERGLYISPEVREQLKVDFTEKEQRAFIKLRSIVVEGVENGLLSGRHASEIEQLLLLVQKSSNKSLPKPRFKKEKVSKARSARKRRVKAAKLLAAGLAAASLETQALHAVETVQAAVTLVFEQAQGEEIPRVDSPPVSEPTENRPAESSLTGSDMVPASPSVPFATPGFSDATPQASSSDVASAEVPERQRGTWIYPPPPDKVWTNKAWNPFSTNQLRLAFDICGVQLPANSLTKSGQRSMSKHALVQVFDHPLVGAVIESRKYRRFLSVYFESQGSAISDDNRLRVGWKVHGTPTGRWSSGAGGGGVGDIGIAVQNWPPLMRKMVVAPEGYLLVGADYNALEFRMIALLSGETVLLDIFNNTTVKRDLHAENTARLYPKVWASLDPKFARSETEAEEYKARRTLMRKFVKTGFYAAVYGAVAMTVQSALRAQSLKETDPQFARMLREVSLKDCKMFVDAVPRFWPRLARWRDQQVSERARSGSWISPLDGRRRVWLMARSERSAFINTPVQGTSGSLMNQRTLVLLPTLAELSSDIHCILQVHDSLVFEAPKDLAPQVKTIVEDTLTTKLKLGDYECLFPVEAAIGQSWKEV